MQKLESKPVVEKIREQVLQKSDAFQKKYHRKPHLAVILVGDDPASHVYVRNKHVACEKVGFQSTNHQMPAITQEQELISHIQKLNQDSAVDAILIQLPLPSHINKERVLAHLDPHKDPDCLTEANLGKFFSGNSVVKPCTPWGVMRILEHYNISVTGKDVVVIGRSLIVGKPMACLLSDANATVTLCHSKTKNLAEKTNQADLVVVAAGKPRFFGKEYFNAKSVVIDVGIHGSGSGQGLCGDVKYDEVYPQVLAITPVPGGVGPMTISTLLENTMALAEARAQKLENKK
ncbi:MAG TPA: bifunctional methylenetetrahydrofolate dehydrogenase/methenyltetrahydrofolate cyclohydrolase FolD [Pseudobdellovibrionaceae bacterium]|nr:bifunctional methylenetetrahydrofolate dehydrogenase/methenyltetrahydrofolate cyclohydrolase FolD [Pseudobdellovibrionaceae bacterium]